MRRWPLLLLGVLLLALVLFFALGPTLVDRSMNRIEGGTVPPVPAAAKALHARLTIVDLHADSFLWSRDVNRRIDHGHADVPRLAEGGVALQLFSSVTKTPAGLNYVRNSARAFDNATLLAIAQLQPIATWTSLIERSLYHAEKVRRTALASEGRLRLVTSAAELDRLLADRRAGRPVIGAMLTVEGLHNLEGRRDNLDRLYEAGFRMASITHFFDNELGGSMHGEEKGGLTPFGREIVRAMEARGMIVDIAHASPAVVAEVLGMAKRPVVSSHGGVRATCPVNRNLDDDQIRGVARTGGLIGIGYWDAAVCDTSPASIAKAIVHVRNLVGARHVALGSDFDGAVTTRFDAAQLAQITAALLAAGLSEREIAGVMGDNALRVIRAGIVPQGERAPL